MEENKKFTKKKADICICIKNRAACVDSFFDEIKKQDCFKDLNIIVCDGRSFDDTAQNLIYIKSAYGYNQMKILQVKEGESYIDAMNLVLNNTVSDYICWIDSDDFMSANKISEQIKYLDEHGDVDVVTTSIILPNEKAISNTLINLDDEIITKALEKGIPMCNICHFQSAMFRRKCLKKFVNNKYFFDEYIGGRAGEGFMYMLHFLGYKFANINTCQYVYTIGILKDSMTNKIEPIFANSINEMDYDTKKEEFKKLMKKYNSKTKDE